MTEAHFDDDEGRKSECDGLWEDGQDNHGGKNGEDSCKIKRNLLTSCSDGFLLSWSVASLSSAEPVRDSVFSDKHKKKV